VVSNKTWKRETAWVMLLGLFYVVLTDDVAMVEAIIWPIFMFIGFAFGMDWYGKQGPLNLGSKSGNSV
jgi:hypothetical protein